MPTPQNSKKKSLNCSDSYRGIALSSIVGKLLDIIILKQSINIFTTYEFRFGFKPKHSTHQCTFVLNEVVNYYVSTRSDMYIVLLDCSKAFDRVNYTKPFSLLINKGLCSLKTRLLANLFTIQKIRVKWGNYISDQVKVTNGVKQGDILSPFLFTMYMDELLLKLK